MIATLSATRNDRRPPWPFIALLGTLVLGLRTAPVQSQSPPKHQGNCTDAGCHVDLTRRPVVHSPVENGACDACHEVEDAAKHKFRLTRNGADLCTECHDETLKDLAFVHGPAAAGQCTACHAPHASERARLLVAEGRDLCFECHDDMKDRIATGKVVHQPVETACLTCHEPHGAANKMMLASTAPELCLDCHAEVAEHVEGAKFKHAPVTQAGGCMECHDAHASEGKRLLARQPPMKLCLSCHNKEIKTSGRTIPNMAALLEANPDHHGPVRDGDCTACHHGHGGPYVAILAEPYPARFYSPFSDEAYKLCFECHEVEAFESAETEDATTFRNGKRNLHYLHVNKTPKGRSCSACHDPHASKNPHHIADRVPFGGWKIPLNYQATETGGGCQPGCHRAYRYDRDTPAVNLPVVVPSPVDKPQ